MRKGNGKRHAVLDASVPERNRIQTRMGKYVFPILFLMGILALFILPQATVSASGLLDIVKDSAHLYSRYGLDNYQLDFYVDTSWTWLPWGWMDGMERGILYAVYHVTDWLWGFSKIISSFTGEVIGESYNLDFVKELSDGLGKSMQNLTGISKKGLSDGFLTGFLPWIMLVTGVYVAYVGLIRRETSRAAGAVVNMFVIFLVTAALIAYAPDYIENINDFSSDVSRAALKAGTGFLMPGTTPADTEDSVELIRDNLFSLQVYQPWLILQFGTADAHIIGDARIENLISKDPQSEYGNTREAVVIEEIEQYQNMYLTAPNVGKRFSMVLVIILVNLIISIVVILLCGAMLLSQIMFLLFSMVLPVSLILAMFPTMGGLAKTAVMRVFNVIMFRAGITLLATAAFSVSGMIYSIAESHSFLMTGYLQIVVFVGIYLKKNEILSMFALHDSGEADMQRSVLRNFLVTAVVRDRMSEMRMFRRMKKRDKEKEREKKKQEARESREQERTERREHRRTGEESRYPDDPLSGNRTSADGTGRGMFRDADSSRHPVRSGSDADGQEQDSAGMAGMPGRRLAEMHRETEEYRTDRIPEWQGKPDTVISEDRTKVHPENTSEGCKKGTGTAAGQQGAEHPSGKKLHMRAAERRNDLLEKRKKAVLMPDPVPRQGEHYHGIRADAPVRVYAAGPSVNLSGSASSPVNQTDTVPGPSDLMNTVRSFRKFLKSRHPVMPGSHNPVHPDKMQDRNSHLTEIRPDSREKQTHPERNSTDRRGHKQDRQQTGNGEKAGQYPENRTAGMENRTVHRETEDAGSSLMRIQNETEENSERKGTHPERNSTDQRGHKQDRQRTGDEEKAGQYPGSRTAVMKNGTVHRETEAGMQAASGKEAGKEIPEGTIYRNRAGKRGDDA